MKVIKLEKAKVTEIVKVLKKGGLVIMPTETVYGAFVDATNLKAVQKLNRYKKRPFGKPYSIAVANQKMAEDYAFLNPTARELYRNFLPGPLTIISKAKGKLPGVESEIKTLGIRIPDYPLITKTIKALKKPVTATSAAVNYQRKAYSIENLLKSLSQKQKDLIDLVIDAGQLPKNSPSTVIDTTADDYLILRQGPIRIKNENQTVSKSVKETKELAKKIWQKYQKYTNQRAVIFALEGKMGSGKTIFTQGLAQALEIKKTVASPTYDLIREYQGKNNLKLIHIDTWRMAEEKEIEEIEFKRKITAQSIIALEWADKVVRTLRKLNEEAVIIWVKITYGQKENERIIKWGII